jgi:serine/threonine protein kinase
MEGGRFLGAGTYGCAFTPPLICKYDTDKKKKYGKIGKVTFDVFAKQEILIGNLIRRIPLARNYFLLPEPESCSLAPVKQQSERELKECHDILTEYPAKDIRQIIEPYGGEKPFYMMYDRLSLHPKRFDFFKFMGHILEAGSILLLAGVCHFDIHPGNLLADKYNTVRILDFGLSFPTANIDEETLHSHWKRLRFGFESDAAHPSIHNSEAPEITIMNATRNNEFTLDQSIQMTIMGKEIFKDMEKYIGISRNESRNELHEFWSTSEFAKKKNYTMIWKTYWPGFDSWSIACILMDTLKILLLLPEFTQGEYKTKKAVLLNVLQGMLQPSPRLRIDCIEALALYDPGSQWIARFGQKWLSMRKQQRNK